MPPDLEPYRRAIGRVFYRKADLAVSDAVLARLGDDRRAFARAVQADVAGEAARVLGLAACAAEPVDGGTLHAVLRVHARGARGWYARTSLPPVPGPAGEFAVDALAAAAAAAAGVGVAVVRHVDLSRTRVPFDLELVDAIPGRAMQVDVDRGGALRALGGVLATLHGVAGRGAGPLDPTVADVPTGVHESWRDFVLGNLDAHLAGCRTDGTLASTEIDVIHGLVREAEPLLASAPRALCHGDLSDANVRVDGGAVTALLDWEDALVGDPLFDLAGWGTFVGHDAHRTALWDGYRMRAALPVDADLRYWFYVVRIMLAKTVHRRRFGYVATDRIPAAARIRPAVSALATHLARGT